MKLKASSKKKSQLLNPIFVDLKRVDEASESFGREL